jgi:hypothetical protein
MIDKEVGIRRRRFPFFPSSKCIFLVLIRHFDHVMANYEFVVKKCISSESLWSIGAIFPKTSKFPRGAHDDGAEDSFSFSFTPMRTRGNCARERFDKRRRVEVGSEVGGVYLEVGAFHQPPVQPRLGGRMVVCAADRVASQEQ